jgi:hypothetical protein
VTQNGARRLAAAIVYRAALDARSGNGEAAAARRWLERDPWRLSWSRSWASTPAWCTGGCRSLSRWGSPRYCEIILK